MSYAENTEVAFEKSVAELTTMLRRKEASQIIQAELDQEYVIQFGLADRMIRFRLPFPALDDMPHKDGRGTILSADARKARLAQAKRQRGRALLLVVKAKLESVEAGIETVEEAFLANVVMSDGKTVYERVAEPMRLEYGNGRPDAAVGLLALPGTRGGMG